MSIFVFFVDATPGSEYTLRKDLQKNIHRPKITIAHCSSNHQTQIHFLFTHDRCGAKLFSLSLAWIMQNLILLGYRYRLHCNSIQATPSNIANAPQNCRHSTKFITALLMNSSTQYPSATKVFVMAQTHSVLMQCAGRQMKHKVWTEMRWNSIESWAKRFFISYMAQRIANTCVVIVTVCACIPWNVNGAGGHVAAVIRSLRASTAEQRTNETEEEEMMCGGWCVNNIDFFAFFRFYDTSDFLFDTRQHNFLICIMLMFSCSLCVILMAENGGRILILVWATLTGISHIITQMNQMNMISKMVHTRNTAVKHKRRPCRLLNCMRLIPIWLDRCASKIAWGACHL